MTVAWTILFHLPIVIVAWRLARRLDVCSKALAIVNAFLLACIVWRIEIIGLGVLVRLGIPGLLHPVSVFVVHLLLLAVSWRLRPLAVTRESAKRSADRFEYACIGGWVAFAFATACHQLLLAADPYDALTYHLQFPAIWFETGSLRWVPTYFGDIAMTYTPEAVETLFMAGFYPLGDDTLARIGQLPFLIASVCIVREWTAPPRVGDRDWSSRVACWASAIAFALLPEMLEQGVSSMVDVATMAFLLAALLHLQRSEKRAIDVYFAGSLFGLFVGSRFTSVVFLFAVLPIVAVELRFSWRAWLRFSIATLLLGGYPYLRNWIECGNPLYPIDLPILGWHGLFTRGATLASRFHLDASQVFEGAKFEFYGTGFAWFIVALCAPFVMAVARWRRAPNAGEPWSRRLALWIALIAYLALHVYAVPYNQNLRFLFPAWALAVVGAAWTLSCLARGRVISSLLAVATAIQFGAELPRWFYAYHFAIGAGAEWSFRVAGIAIAAVLLGSSIGWQCALWRGRRRIVLAVVVGVATGLLVDACRIERQASLVEIHRSSRYAPYADGLAALIDAPAGSTIAFTGLNVPYLLRAGDRRHRTLVVSVDGGSVDLPPHEQRERLPRFTIDTRTNVLDLRGESYVEPDHDAWWQRLRDENVDYLAIFYERGKPRPIEGAWAQQDSRFERCGGGELSALQVFRVRRGQ